MTTDSRTNRSNPAAFPRTDLACGSSRHIIQPLDSRTRHPPRRLRRDGADRRRRQSARYVPAIRTWIATSRSRSCPKRHTAAAATPHPIARRGAAGPDEAAPPARLPRSRGRAPSRCHPRAAGNDSVNLTGGESNPQLPRALVEFPRAAGVLAQQVERDFSVHVRELHRRRRPGSTGPSMSTATPIRMRRVLLRGHTNILKRVLLQTAALNLGLLMRTLFGVGTPREKGRVAALICCLWTLIRLPQTRESPAGRVRRNRFHHGLLDGVGCPSWNQKSVRRQAGVIPFAGSSCPIMLNRSAGECRPNGIEHFPP